MIEFEYPFNERIRTLMRLEDLFGKTIHFMQQEGPLEHHAAIGGLFELLEVGSRSDLKLDLIQELERQRQTLLVFRNNPDIVEGALSGALYEIEQASATLLAVQGRIGQHLRDNEWLMSLKGRTAIPGGVCEFDVPSYHYWLHRPSEERKQTLQDWLRPLLPLREALSIVLRLLRASGRSAHYEARNGLYQLMLSGSQTQMARVTVPYSDGVIPEISANKYALNIRFVLVEANVLKMRTCERDIGFEMMLCNL